MQCQGTVEEENELTTHPLRRRVRRGSRVVRCLFEHYGGSRPGASTGGGASAPAASASGGAAGAYIPIVSKGFQHQFWQAVKQGAEDEGHRAWA